MFEKDILVRCKFKAEEEYKVFNRNALCKVIAVSEFLIKVEIVSHTYPQYVGSKSWVKSKNFQLEDFDNRTVE